MNTQMFRCKFCKRGGMPVEVANRHINLVHKLDAMPRCKTCGDVAEYKQPRAKEFSACAEHATRFATHRWCGRPKETGQGIGSTCHCHALGYLSDTWLEVAVQI